METAHQFGSEITGVQFAYDNRMLATRSNDETLKLWDVRWVNNLQQRPDSSSNQTNG